MNYISDLQDAITYMKIQKKLDIKEKSRLYDLAIEAMEIQIPKHPIVCHDDDYGADADGNRGIRIDWIECPNCGYELSVNEEKMCPECHQVLDLNYE